MLPVRIPLCICAAASKLVDRPATCNALMLYWVDASACYVSCVCVKWSCNNVCVQVMLVNSELTMYIN